MRSKMIIIGPRFPEGGIPTYIKTLEKYLKKEGLEVISISPYVFYPTKMTARDILHRSFIKNSFIKLFIFISNMGKIIKIVSTKRNFVAHVHTAGGWSFWENSIYITLLKVFKIPVILHVHTSEYGYTYLKNANWLKRKLIKKVFEKSDIVIVLSEHWEELFSKEMGIPKHKLVVVPNGVDISRFEGYDYENCRKKLGLPSDKKVIFSLGNLIERKGFRYLIESLSEVVKYRKDFICFIGGDGPDKDNLQKMIDNMGLEEYVKLIGYVPDDLLPIWMNAADIFVLPSLGEGVPLVMFEALACGLPFIGTKVGGIPEIITSEDYGLLCEPANPKDLAEKILIALEKEWNREKIRKYAERFTWDKIARKVIEVYYYVMDGD